MPIINSATKAIVSYTKSANFDPERKLWMIDGGQIIDDQELELEWQAPEPMLTPIEFKLSFTSAERVKIRAARKTDPKIDDYMLILEDPRLIEIDSNRPEWQEMRDYLTSKSK